MRRSRRWDILSRHSQFQVWVGEVQFYESSYFGWIIATVLLLGGFSYFGGGYWYNSRSRGLRGAAALPHRQFWMEVAGLVEDGVNFSRETVHGRSGRSRGNAGSRGRSADIKERASLLGKTKVKKTSSSKDKSKKGKSNDASKRKTGKSAVGDGNPGAENNYGATSSAVPQDSPPGSDSEVRLPSAAGTAAGDGGYSSFRRCSYNLHTYHKLYCTAFVRKESGYNERAFCSHRWAVGTCP